MDWILPKDWETASVAGERGISAPVGMASATTADFALATSVSSLWDCTAQDQADCLQKCNRDGHFTVTVRV